MGGLTVINGLAQTHVCFRVVFIGRFKKRCEFNGLDSDVVSGLPYFCKVPFFLSIASLSALAALRVKTRYDNEGDLKIVGVHNRYSHRVTIVYYSLRCFDENAEVSRCANTYAQNFYSQRCECSPALTYFCKYNNRLVRPRCQSRDVFAHTCTENCSVQIIKSASIWNHEWIPKKKNGISTLNNNTLKSSHEIRGKRSKRLNHNLLL